MILKSALDLKNSINKDRQRLYQLAKNMGNSDPNVIQISRKLDEKIFKMQQLMEVIRRS
ncbi:putative glycosyltransferase involved in capsule biosynthesis [Neobacillus niacini]|uniref:Spo0E family sporulation regulatory protein-aspartic acid phosphatase n=1 Tax=Neobacillus niacini TaxID=86668 RepID=UPI00277F25FA|nr:Spo0E family sporulation regulatory protein-aspartic acid phosphatase [Neobacillus niacini]MDQ1005294.1 putative glycosyltransferase involved in capsule biosynthesis [Neobacillus niacini]